MPANNLRGHTQYSFKIGTTDNRDTVWTSTQGFSTANNNPVSTQSLDSILVNTSQKTFARKLNNYFADPDNDALTYTAQSSNPNITPIVSNDSLYIQGTDGILDSGNVVVTANDGFGGTIDDTLKVKLNTLIDIPDFNNAKTFRMYQNYPNPFNPSTTIQYDLPSTAVVQIGVYNILGQQVKKYTPTVHTAGTHKEQFNSEGLASGIYFIMIHATTIKDNKTHIKVIKSSLVK